MAPHLPLPDETTAAPALAGEYAAAREREGSVMAILRAMGPRVEVLRAFLALAEAALYGPAALGRRERELLALATSQANEAEYSAEAHAALLEQLGGRPDATTTELQGLRSSVPRRGPRPCISGSGDCVGG
jgi:AhpD family alkylhydroperoxidase